MEERIPNQVRFLVLSVIDNNADLDDLHKMKYSYSQITNLIKNEIQTGNAQFENQILSLTDLGKALKSELAKQLKISRNDEVVLPRFSAKLEEAISVSEIFVPSQKELDF